MKKKSYLWLSLNLRIGPVLSSSVNNFLFLSLFTKVKFFSITSRKLFSWKLLETQLTDLILFFIMVMSHQNKGNVIRVEPNKQTIDKREKCFKRKNCESGEKKRKSCLNFCMDFQERKKDVIQTNKVKILFWDFYPRLILRTARLTTISRKQSRINLGSSLLHKWWADFYGSFIRFWSFNVPNNPNFGKFALKGSFFCCFLAILSIPKKIYEILIQEYFLKFKTSISENI